MLQSNPKRATALKYSANKTDAPVVVASGMGYTAQKIVEIASQNDVPIYQDDSLATLLSQLDVGVELPQELYQAIVDIYVYFLGFNDMKKELTTGE